MDSLLNRPIDLNTLFKFKDLDSSTQGHLSKVYAALAVCITAAVVGCLISLRTGFGGMGTLLLGIGCIFGMLFSDEKSSFKPAFFAGFGFFKGMSLGPLVGAALAIEASIVLTALLSTTAIFVCLSLGALMCKKRSMLYLGSMLGSGLLILSIMNLMALFGMRSEFMMNLQLGMGLLIFMGYVVYDTQLIVAKAESGNRDYLHHALELFIDFAAIFVRILIILMKNNEKKKE